MKSFRDNKQFYFRIFSLIFTVCSLVYLTFSLYQYQYWDELIFSWKNIPRNSFYWLIPVVLLFPVNWLTEAWKWKKIVAHTERLKMGTAIRAVLAGASTGFITPNKLGDIIGKVTYLKEENRKPAISLAAINSLTNNIAILIPGIPASFLFFFKANDLLKINPSTLLIIYLLFTGILILLLVKLPETGKRIKSPGMQVYFKGVLHFSVGELIEITLISLFRVVVFSTQLYFMLRLFEVNPGINASLIAIPASYLFITFTPSFALSEGIIRSSWALFFIGYFTHFNPGIALAGAGIWLINIVIPVIAGNVLLMMKNRKLKSV